MDCLCAIINIIWYIPGTQCLFAWTRDLWYFNGSCFCDIYMQTHIPLYCILIWVFLGNVPLKKKKVVYVPLRSVEIAMLRCQRYIHCLNHDDLDEEEDVRKTLIRPKQKICVFPISRLTHHFLADQLRFFF